MASADSTFAANSEKPNGGALPLFGARRVAYFYPGKYNRNIIPWFQFFPAQHLFAFPGAKLAQQSRKDTDIAVVGGGLAGSTAAAMRGCTGISTVLIDPPSGQSIRFPRRKNQRRRAARPPLPDRNRRFGAALGHP
ncbi:hypothetical protein IVA95_09440 [Bradyrhizobium sp. 157]|nr:hypothetical protein [Bradyrhizobium sp. 157]